ncbi:hypothetical protein LINPERPRIM_LOCUS22928 [Linum perenne]
MVEDNDEAELARFIKMAKRKIMLGEESWIDEQMADPMLKGKCSHKQAERMVEIGLSCVDVDRNKRPTIGIVQSLLDCQDYKPNSTLPESSSSPASKISTLV